MIVVAITLAATNPVDSGAVAGDGLDDGSAFRSALAEACATDHLLEVPAGVFDVGQQPGKLGGLNITGCNGLTIRGAGRAATRLRMVPSALPFSADYYLINIDGLSQDIELTGLTLDGRRDTFTEAGAVAEQVHLIRTYNVSRIDLHDMDMVDSFGDCMKNINADDVGVVNVRCRGSRRDGINSHSNSEDVRIVASSFSGISDQHIATEGSGGNKRWTLVGNSHIGSGGLTHDIGTGAEDVTIVGNTILNGGLQSYQTDDITIAANTISMTTSSGTPIALKGRNANAVLMGNVVNSLAMTSEAACFQVLAMDATRDASSIAFVGNSCTHAGPSGITLSSGTGRLIVDANLIRSAGALTTGAGVSVSNFLPGQTARDIVVSDNVITDEGTGISVGAARAIDHGAISGNVVRSSKYMARGIYTQWFNASGTPPPRVCRVDANIFDVPGVKVTNTRSSPPYGADPGDGCLLHGDGVGP